jgi:hypothetical protein
MRSFFFLAALGTALVLLPERSAAGDTATTPALIVKLPSIDGALADLKYLAGLAGREAEAKQIDEQVKKTFPKGFLGVDTKRPLGAYGILDRDGNLQDITGALLVPITDERAFLGLLENFNFKMQKGEDGVYSLPAEEGKVAVHLRFAHRYAYVAIKDKSVLAPQKLPSPNKVLTIGPTEAIAASFRIDQIPTPIKQVILSNAETRLTDVEDQRPAGETAAQHAFKVQAAKELARQFTALLKEGEEVTARLEIDRQTKTLGFQASLNGKSGSHLAAGIAALGPSPSLFAGLLGRDSAFSGLVHLSLRYESVRQTWASLIDAATQTGLQNEKDKTKRARAEKFIQALVPSFKSGELDAGAALRRSGSNKHYTLVAALKLKDGAAVEQAFRAIVQDLAPAERARIKLDLDSLDTTRIHRIDVQKDFDDEARKDFGDNPFYLAIRNDAVFVSGGDDGLKVMKEALAGKAGPAPTLQVELGLARLAPLLTKGKKADSSLAVKKAFGDPPHNDKIRFTIEGGDSLKLRLELNAPVIRFFGLIDKPESAP